MKKNRTSFAWRTLKLFLILSSMIAIFTIAVHAEEINGGTFQIDTWFKETALPILFAFLSASAVNYLETLPLMNKINRASGKFESTTANVNSVVEATLMHEQQLQKEREEWQQRIAQERIDAQNRIDAYEEKIRQMNEAQSIAIEAFLNIAQGYEQKLAELEGRLTPELQKAVHSSEKIEQMVYLGFTNQCEMVKNGCARKIAEIEEEVEG